MIILREAMMIGPSNVRHVSGAVIFLLMFDLASPVRSAASEISSPYRQKRLFYGCWKSETRHPDRVRWKVSSSTWCFERRGTIAGKTFDAGDGWDYTLLWRADGQRLTIDGSYKDGFQCLYAVSPDGRTLILRDCPSAGEWHRDDETTRVSQGPAGRRILGPLATGEQPDPKD
ncbi:hypothetical protein SAMN02799631_01595 [Methylobacterium sp. 174MFSha1.1]|uniref:hypothetical protein n=1 Tax=Methylobacterium sp. 174MFSha1.1 TaxID=1502749 RepID=UPI0008EF7F81|nr:hypothetical protein [Methylobacterium sp. 174MFSha1.1]SFU65176.1 hypothetical protein SAMN02799631_01595 [Methylobacterium sp. 174MFSha1.1]